MLAPLSYPRAAPNALLFGVFDPNHGIYQRFTNPLQQCRKENRNTISRQKTENYETRGTPRVSRVRTRS
jgi:hypothetical protein